MKKLHKLRIDLLALAYLPAIILSILIVIFLPQVLLNIDIVGGLLLIILIIGIILTPLGNLRFSIGVVSSPQADIKPDKMPAFTENKAITVFKKFVAIVLIETIVTIVDRGTQIAAYAIHHAEVQHSNMVLLIDKQADWYHFALFPWVLYALFGAALAWVRTQSTADAVTYADSLEILLKKYLTPSFIISVDFLLRTSFIVIFTTTICFLFVQCVYGIVQATAMPLTMGYLLRNGLMGVFIMQMLFSKKAYKLIHYLSYSNKSLGVSLIILMATLFLQFCLLSWLLDFIARHLRHPHYIIMLPHWLVKLSASDFIFLTFQSVWQLAVAAGIGLCLARIARGLSMRVFFFLMLLPPFLIQLLDFVAMHFPQQFGIIFWVDILQNISIYLINPYILPGLALTILCICLLRLDGTSELLRLSLSTIPYEIRRIPTNLLRGLIYNLSLLILIAWTGGVDIILLANIIMVVPIIVVAVMIISSFMKAIIVK